MHTSDRQSADRPSTVEQPADQQSAVLRQQTLAGQALDCASSVLDLEIQWLRLQIERRRAELSTQTDTTAGTHTATVIRPMDAAIRIRRAA